MKKIVLLTLCSILFIQAQSLMALRYPAGLVSPRTGLSARMGGVGIGSTDPYQMMAYNPGNLGNIQQSVYSLKFTLDLTRVIENEQYSDFLTMVPDLVGFAFPLGKIGTFGLSFSKERGTSYNYVSEQGTLTTNETTGEILTGWTGYYYKTGVTAWDVAWGHSAWKAFRPGIGYRRYYYKTEINTVTQNDSYKHAADSTHMVQTGNAFRGGITGTIGDLTYGVSGTYNFTSDLKYHNTTIKIDSGKTNSQEQIHEDASEDKTYELQLAPSAGIGLSYKLNDRMTVATDYSMEFWDDGYISGPALVYPVKYQNTMTTATGFKFIPAPELLSPRYFEKMEYSGGFRFSTLPVEGDWEAALSLGVGLPLGAAGLVDIAFEGGMRRSDDLPDNEENFFRFTISSSGGKKWAKRNNSVY